MLSSFTSADILPPHALLAGRYCIVRKIGEGGFGVVYQAQDTRHKKKRVAIKQINLGALSTRQIIEATAPYNREITLLPRLRHKNLPFYALAVAIPFLTNTVGWPLFLLLYILLTIWQVLLIGQLLTALLLFFQPGKRFLAYGILIMLAIIYLAIPLGWHASVTEFMGRLWPGPGW